MGEAPLRASARKEMKQRSSGYGSAPTTRIRQDCLVDVLVVGGGPAGLAAAIELRRRGVARVRVVERERELGGVPRHADHTGFGLRDLHRLLTGPAYARRYAELAHAAGVELRTETTVTRWLDERAVQLSGPHGPQDVEARALVLATGCRERPRSARLVPGDRPAGVFTTGSLQQLVHLHGRSVGRRAVVVGAEHVSFSALLTLAHAGARTVAMVTEQARHQTYLPYKWLSATRLRVPVLTSQRLARIEGRGRVEAVELVDVHSGATRRVECDTVVFSGDWIPDHELARRGDLAMDPGTRGPRVDGALRTSRRGVFAAGNLVHAAETADVAALGGRHAAVAAFRFLETDAWPRLAAVPILCEPPVLWVSPSAVRGETPPRGRFVWRVSEPRHGAEVVVAQGERVLWRRRFASLVPALPLAAPAYWLGDVDPSGPAITFGVSD
jgi:thioredoxin reductase